MGRWTCDAGACQRVVEYDGSDDGLFSFRRRNKQKQWMVFTRGIVDQLLSFIISSRSTYTAATRHLANTIACFRSRRQDVVKLGTAAARAISIPPESARCPICGPNPAFIVIDAQSIGCTDTDNVRPLRPTENCPVLPIDASKLCILHNAALRVAVDKVLSSSKPLTPTQEQHLREWDGTRTTNARPSVEAAAANVFFRFFPLGSSSPVDASGAVKDEVVVKDGVGDDASSGSSEAGDSDGASARARKARRVERGDRGLEASLRQDEDGNLVLGKKGKRVKLPAETWRDRVGICAPNFASHARDDDGAWLCIRPFLKAMLAETATGMFQAHDEKAVALLADGLRLKGKETWRTMTRAADGVGFVSSFIGLFDDDLDGDKNFRVAVGTLLGHAVELEKVIDAEFAKEASSNRTKERQWVNMGYCSTWGGRPTASAFDRWRASHPTYHDTDSDDPLVSYEFFASLPRVRPGISDSVAAERRRQYKDKKRHAADKEGEEDSCNKAFSVMAGLTQGVFNVVCPHVITLGFRVLFNAESVGEALSIVLERFPELPKVIFYDVACKIDKNAMRRVRPILRNHGVRCILDRPHSITDSCSPVYMPDESLGATSGVATQAAEVSHSISVGNRTSLAYMAPDTYMVHRMLQVAHMNLRKLAKLFSGKPRAENDHIPLASFFHRRISHSCQRGPSCGCDGQGAVSPLPADDVAPAVVVDRAQPLRPLRDQDGVDAPPAAGQVRLRRQGGDGAVREHPRQDPQPAVGRYIEVPAWLRACATRSSGPNCRPLSKEEKLLVVSLTAEQDGDEVVRPRNRANIDLSVADFALLRGDNWLNDQIMNSFFKLINYHDDQMRASVGGVSGAADAAGSTWRRTRCLNTYFYNRMYSPRMGRDFRSVRSWVRTVGLDLAAVDTIVIPLNLGRVHWVLVVIDVANRDFKYCDSFLDGDKTGAVPHLRAWLKDEVRHQLCQEAADAMQIDDWPLVENEDVPEQFDGSSCGVFALAAAECFAAGVPLSYTQDDMDTLRERVAIDLFIDDLVCSL